jgi:hypothetical protein
MAALDWPEKITVSKRNYRSRRALESYKIGMIKRAAADRKNLFAEAERKKMLADIVAA